MNLSNPLDPQQVPAEWWVERMKNIRNNLLAQSDWTMHIDAPTDKTAWGAYRQALRDFPSTWEISETANLPEPPNA